MIAIKRPDPPLFLLDQSEKWYKETSAAVEHYKQGGEKAFDFACYNDAKLKDELKKIFTKCAYCESRYSAVYDGDVEHFRPKGKIKEKEPQTPGYYWLANDWENLFLACQHCNQRRKHILYGEEKLEGYGKLDQFPLDDEVQRLKGPDSLLEQEEAVRLLLNPCKDNPDEHLAYDETEGVIRGITKKGETSIRVYVLQRPLLVQERKMKLLKLYHQIAVVELALRQMNQDPENQVNKQLFAISLEILLEFGKSDEPYAGMCRYFIRRFLTVNNLR